MVAILCASLGQQNNRNIKCWAENVGQLRAYLVCTRVTYDPQHLLLRLGVVAHPGSRDTSIRNLRSFSSI